jgi:hypothetical protein
MVEFFQLIVLVLAIAPSPPSLGLSKHSKWLIRLRVVASKPRLVVAVVGCATFLGCIVMARLVLHEPVPRVHDEFSYLLMADTFATGHVSNPAPFLPEFFDTFHVLMHPAYVSKYFPLRVCSLLWERN